MRDTVIVGCLDCGAISDAFLDELDTAKCSGCGATNFVRQGTIGEEMELKFIEDFFAARLKIMELQ